MGYSLAKFTCFEIIEENLGVGFVRLAGLAESHCRFLFQLLKPLFEPFAQRLSSL
jgi:hypothetical protein